MSEQEKTFWEMSNRELFERSKELDESIQNWRYDDAEDEDEFANVRALMIRDFNDHYVLLFRRMFRKHKMIFRINPEW
jgi:hypothetical protein